MCSAEPVQVLLQVKDNESLYPAFYKLTDSRSQITSCAYSCCWLYMRACALPCTSMASNAGWP